MKIVVAMKQAPDLQQIRIRNCQPILEGVPYTFGIIDKNALEAAVSINEEVDGEVIVVSAGNEELEDTIKEALAADADSSILMVNSQVAEMDSGQIAQVLVELIKKADGYDLIIFGEGSGDNYSGLMGSRVAELLELPQVGYVTAIEVSKDQIAQSQITVKRSLENQDEILEIQLPAVLVVAADLNKPRIPSVTKVLKAGKKPKEVFGLEELQINLGEKQTVTISNLAPLNERMLGSAIIVPESVAQVANTVFFQK